MKKIIVSIFSLCLAISIAAPASALEYTIQAPAAPEFGKATSVEVIYTADRGEQANEDLSKSAALIPPLFGSPTSYLPASGDAFSPYLLKSVGEVAPIFSTVGQLQASATPGVTVQPAPIYPATAFTALTTDLYYSGGYIAALKIPSLGVSVKVYEGTGSTSLAKGAGHFPETSVWDGNVAIAGHNRGVNCYFGNIHTLSIGDTIAYTTKLGTRTYAVTSVAKISETDHSMLTETADNRLTLFTCVRDEKAYRWCVQAVEI